MDSAFFIEVIRTLIDFIHFDNQHLYKMMPDFKYMQN